MSKESLVVGIAALIIGFLLGTLVGGKLMSGKHHQTAQQPAQNGNSMSEVAIVTARITELEQIVSKDPKNLKALIALGNDYFDTNQPQKAAQAYNKALEIDPNNPHVLTDQGVMFRALGFFDRALANFEKAGKLDPTHLQGLYNIGIIYAVDLKQPEKAKAAFEEILKKDQNSDLARQAREMIKQLQSVK